LIWRLQGLFSRRQVTPLLYILIVEYLLIRGQFVLNGFRWAYEIKYICIYIKRALSRRWSPFGAVWATQENFSNNSIQMWTYARARLRAQNGEPNKKPRTNPAFSIQHPTHFPHQWDNLWNAILTFSKVSFIAYMSHLGAGASVSAAEDSARWRCHYAVAAPKTGWVHRLASTYDWDSSPVPIVQGLLSPPSWPHMWACHKWGRYVCAYYHNPLSCWRIN